MLDTGPPSLHALGSLFELSIKIRKVETAFFEEKKFIFIGQRGRNESHPLLGSDKTIRGDFRRVPSVFPKSIPDA